MTLQLQEDQKKTLNSEVVPMLANAKGLEIKIDEHKRIAIEFRKGIKELKEKIEVTFHPTKNKQDAYRAYENALDTEKAFYNPLNEADDCVRLKIKGYERDIALEAQRKAQEIEAKRLEAERIEREKLLAKAQKAEEKGKIEKAESLREQAESPQLSQVIEVSPPVATKKLVWRANVTNMTALCKSIADGKVPFSVLQIRESALKDFAKLYDGKSKIDGLSFYQDVNR